MSVRDFLAEMGVSSRERADMGRPRAELLDLVRDLPPARSVERTPFGLIAEIKLASPSEGRLSHATDDAAHVAAQARAYSRVGASAISVLTEPSAFGGDLGHLAAASDTAHTPTMRKDFLVDPIQLLEARVHGASGALLIARMLDDALLERMLDEAAALGLFVLLECFDERDCERACLALDGRPTTPEVMTGINTRDLSTLEVREDRLATLVHALPRDRRRVAESGLRTPDDAARAAAMGYDLALVGTALMRANDPASLARAMLDAGSNASLARRDQPGALWRETPGEEP
ncbi:MAG: indole-3-glycerol-phosphate synthase [Phycisphaeraceae bacterium]|nr:indole-3-glycerol-phosphate synthase [Phycisphaeraceae bacterium]